MTQTNFTSNFFKETFNLLGLDIYWSILIIFLILIFYVLIFGSYRKKRGLKTEIEINTLIVIVFYIASLFGGFIALFFSLTGKTLFSEKGNLHLFMLLSGVITIFFVWRELRKIIKGEAEKKESETKSKYSDIKAILKKKGISKEHIEELIESKKLDKFSK